MGLSWAERLFTHSGALAEVMRGYLSAGLTSAPLMTLSPRVTRACGVCRYSQVGEHPKDILPPFAWGN